MKIKSLALTFLISITLSLSAHALEQTISLKDGSTIKGEITNMANGVYTIKTTSMGTAQIKADQIGSINNGTTAPNYAHPPAYASPPSINAQVGQLQNQIMGNPAMMMDIQQIASDPEIIKLISNPAMMQAVMSKDMDAIRANPATAELMKNPKLQALIEKFQANRN